MAEKNLYDAIVIGGGPAGLTAGIYLARARYRVLVIEKEKFGGQITITSEVVNYPGVERTDGKKLTETMRRQAENFGAEFLLAEVHDVETGGDVKTVRTSRGEFQSFTVLLATGAHPRMVGFEGESDFRGHGVAYCATCDGEFFTGKQVFVVGGGFAAAEESVFLTKYASHVTILIRGEDFTCAKTEADAARNNEKITVLTNTSVVRVEGETVLERMVYKNNVTGEETVYEAPEGDTFGVFVFAGYEPETGLLKGKAELDDRGYVVTDRSQQTSCPGIYAAGDVCIKNLRQVVTAVGDGALAATEMEKYAAAMQKKTGLKPETPEVRKREDSQTHSQAHSEKDGSAGTGTGTAGENGAPDSGIFTPEILAQLDGVFARMDKPLTLKLYLDQRPVSAELKAYIEAMADRTDKITAAAGEDDAVPPEERPCVKVLRREDSSDTGLAFHGVPGGHEFTSFVLGLYNAAGPGQSVDSGDLDRIRKIEKPVKMKILVSLSCTMCPELVTAAQKIAAENPLVTAEVYDLNHFPAYKDQYHVMSVPCMVTNDGQVTFGKKTLPQLLDYLEGLDKDSLSS